MGFSPSLVDKVIEEKGKMNNFVSKFIEREKSIHMMKNNPWLFPDDHSLQTAIQVKTMWTCYWRH